MFAYSFHLNFQKTLLTPFEIIQIFVCARICRLDLHLTLVVSSVTQNAILPQPFCEPFNGGNPSISRPVAT